MFQAQGVSGALCVGSRVAVAIADWTLTQNPESLGAVVTSLTFKRVAEDEFWSTQKPLQVWLDFDDAWWVWSNVEQLGDGHFRLVGDPDIRECQWVNSDLNNLKSSDSN